jgi:glutathione peroxidase
MLAGIFVSIAMIAAPVVAPRVSPAPSRPPAETPKKGKAMSLHDLSVRTIDGQAQSLSAWKGQVLLVVNTASECGNTPQYADLEKLWQEYRGKGFAVLGFPSNDFGGQEPGTEAEIKRFCSLKYKVTFPMFAKVKTKGDGQSPVYKFLNTKHDAPRWNFHKFVVGKDGQVVRAFGDGVSPADPDLRAAIDAALKG